MLARIGAWFDEMLAARVFDLVATMPLKGAKASESLQPIRDLDQIRGFLSGMGPTAFFDMPFMPIFFSAASLSTRVARLAVGGRRDRPSSR